MLKFVFPGLVVSTLCGCGDGAPRQFPPDRPAWITTVDDGRARLAYGLPNSEETALTLECAPHSGQVTVSGPLAPGASTLTLVSGAAVDEIAGTPTLEPEGGVNVVAGRADPRAPALAAFARTGQLVRADAGGATSLPASGAEQARVRSFLDGCAR